MRAADITVIIPHIPERPNRLANAIRSVALQSVKPREIIIATDTEMMGSAHTRNRALDKVSTTWVAFLDDDDEFLPHHLETLIDTADDSGADVIYSGCRVINPALGGDIPVREEWGRFNHAFNPKILRERSYIPVTSLVRTCMAQIAQFGPPDHDLTSPYDDWGFYLRLLDHGAMFVHVPVVSWIWHHHGNNTSGLVTKRQHIHNA